MKQFLNLLTLLLICSFTILFFTNKNNPLKYKDNYNIMILGLDPRNDALEKTNTTDTIIFASLNLHKPILNLISLPRDLWSYQDKYKINQIYPQNIDKFDIIQTKFSDLTGQKINNTIIITTQNLIDLVSKIDGVDLYLDQGFIDTKYPNPEYIKNPSKEIPIYKTIEFKTGNIHLDSSNITEFVRSRHGSETATTGGTDLGRMKRQQVLIEAIFKKALSTKYLAQLFDFYRHDLKSNFSFKELVNLAIHFKLKILNLKLNKIDLPVGTNAKNGVIYYPNKLTEKQWAFIPSDLEYKSFQEFIKTAILN